MNGSAIPQRPRGGPDGATVPCIAADGSTGWADVANYCHAFGGAVEPKRIGPEAPSPYKALDDLIPEWVRYASWAAGAACAYHGYRRTGSALWAVGWSLFGVFAFPLAVPIALAQGFGEPKRRANPGRRRRRRR